MLRKLNLFHAALRFQECQSGREKSNKLTQFNSIGHFETMFLFKVLLSLSNQNYACNITKKITNFKTI